MRRLLIISVILLMTFIYSCANKQVIAPEVKKAAEVAKVEIPPASTDTENRGIDTDTDSDKNKSDKNIVVEEGIKEPEITTTLTDIFFDYDKSDIKPEAKAGIKSASDYMIANHKVNISAEGHCDEIGSSEYNLALGDKRAKSVKDYLVSLGVSSDKISTFSYGKEAPQCTEHAESCWSKNRRVHFVVTKGGVK